MEKVDSRTFDFMADMASHKELGIESVDLNSMYRPGSWSHSSGLGIDIGSIKYIDGSTLSFAENSNPTGAALNHYNQLYAYIGNNGYVSQYWDPYRRITHGGAFLRNYWKSNVSTYGNALLGFDVPGGTGLDGFNSYISNYGVNDSERSAIWSNVTHRHHLHITIKGGQ